MVLIERFKQELKRDKHFAELIRGASTAFVFKVIGIVFGYLFMLLVTRTLGAKAWGIFALSLVVLQIASLIGRLGMDTALLRFTAEYVAKGRIDVLKDIYKKILTLAILVSIWISALVYFLSPVLANKVFHKPCLTDYFHVVSFMIVPFVLLFINSEGIRGLKKIKEYMLLQQTGVLIITLILFLMGLLFVRVFFLPIDVLFLPIVSYGLSILVLSAISIYLWKRYLQDLFLTKFLCDQSADRLISYSTILDVSIPMFLSSSITLVMGWTDTVILGIFRNVQEIGIYNTALKLSNVTAIVLIAINTIVAAKFAEFFGKNDFKSLEYLAKQATKLVFWISAPIIIGYLLFPGWFMGLFGEEFKKGSLALIILSAGQFVNAATGSVGLILVMTGKQKIHRNLMVMAVIGNIALNFFLIPKFGMSGAALATALTQILTNLVAMFLVRKYYGFYTISGIGREGACRD